MAAQSRLTLLFAALVGALLSLGSASAQGKRPWIDPPADVGTQSGPSPGDKSPGPVQPPSEKPAARPEVPSSNAVETAGPAAPERTAPAASARRRVAAPAARSAGVSSAVPKSAAKRTGTTVAARSVTAERRQALRTARAKSESRILAAERPLEVMNLQTIELPDGRRFNVLTRPRPPMFESVLTAP
jgi:predicted component of type VI protein secretion system